MRAFIALDVNSIEAIGKFKEAQSLLLLSGADLKLVEAQNLHFTLKFLGEISEVEANTVSERLDDIVFDAVKVVYRGLGVFPSRSHISVVWVGVDREAEENLKKLALTVQGRLKELRLGDEKPFQPHLTIARVKTGRNRDKLVEIVDSMRERNLASDMLTSLKLKSSTLTPTGPMYRDLHVTPLKSAAI